jgi:hypothetical protein
VAGRGKETTMELTLVTGNGEFTLCATFPEATDPPTDCYWTFYSQQEAEEFADKLASEGSKAEPSLCHPSKFRNKDTAENCHGKKL